MKTIITSFIFILYGLQVNAQYNEFKTHSNGLIYDEQTVAQLRFIVDSLNLKFKACEITETYYALPQAKVLVIDINSRSVRRDIKNGITLEAFKEKYPNRSFSKPELLVYDVYENYQDKMVTRFSTKSLANEYDRVLTIEKELDPMTLYSKGSWIYDKDSDRIFYLLEDFKKEPLKDEYAHMIQYADCMIDTTSTKIYEKAEHGYIGMPEDYRKLSKQKKEELLEKMRNTRVVGSCSMDSSPRVHAMNIAKLSAETVNWEVFLKAHLDIMNDRFDRVSDGSYAYAARKTYLKELETLDIDINSLIFGISFRAENVHENHYYGSISRIGRAIADAEDKASIERKLISLISDSELDDYNRYLMYWLYANYLYYLNEDPKDTSEINEKLKIAKDSLPDYLVGNS
ncbi:hypothetical protein [Winogradskyella tangerina]|uniref:hypothetical protein n=1 Tax=Winogradskyella tangerina TaxID=2023240 RepID=UPI000DBE8BA5|nr:hypothetical protein [Winogradskyella tangerina]